ncbi:conserved protein of unknown function [Candidatus Hydrogenisulfobacillus filiaventi]|uniref:Amylo-alpha-1,6-glucosidase n=1 Tax=Candidatus Hydrogenisulfobacillus filiaventi TaxID=2707344 RepID=A0A6F8ZFY6_9FIRM|nr:amylo-alpha-1,6-glucosidase [Bacillota bacterium]CAB1128899.1 conserved protein of unknown function [Candidatus Hydrogenisulfobacillus filiaventi]
MTHLLPPSRQDFSQPDAYGHPAAVLKEGELFYVGYAEDDDCRTDGGGGLYYRDTRFLSCLAWRIAGTRPQLLSAGASEPGRAQMDATNHELLLDGIRLPAHRLHLRISVLVADRLYQRLRLLNFSDRPVAFTLDLLLAADFRDIFEVRGLQRVLRGELLEPRRTPDGVRFAYRGLDGVLRETVCRMDPPPDRVEWDDSGRARLSYHLELPPGVKEYRYLEVLPVLHEPGETADPGPAMALSRGFARAAFRQAREYRDWEASCTRIETDNRVYSAQLRQATMDMRALLTSYPGQGRIIAAGIPWYVAPFGRDALITGIETLILNPVILIDSLRFLARYQGVEENHWREEEPGKILHELRRGEMARCNEVPHTPYYGSVDSTLWWIIGLYEAWNFTGDRGLLEELAPALKRALDWIGRYGDMDGDGLVEYQRRSPRGLDNQGWKDSWDAVQDAEGRPPEGPVALVEVQGYAYHALRAGAVMLTALGEPEEAEQLRRQADRLREVFLSRFWDPVQGRVALALDGHKRPLWVESSNPGHLLFTGILPRPAARQVARSLFRTPMFSGWGIRTLAETAPYYNPLSYHNGSVWPHDNAIVAWGLKTLGEGGLLMTLARSLYEAAQFFPQGRLPELFCGFTRRQGGGPVHYPVACDPQSWAAATPFMLLRLLLGIEAQGRRIVVRRPELPPWVDSIYLRQLAIGSGHLDIEFARGRGVTYANVVRMEGDLSISIEPV